MVLTGDGSGLKIYDPGQVRSLFWCSVWVGSATSESGKFPLRIPFFIPGGQKKSHLVGVKNTKAGWPLFV